MTRFMATLATSVCVAGCAHIDFGAEGLLYYEPTPYLFISRGADCASTATVVVLPGKAKRMNFVPGYGSAELSATLSAGMITTVGQTTDTKVPETLTALAALRTAAGTQTTKDVRSCPAAALFRIVDGEVGKEVPLRPLTGAPSQPFIPPQ